MNMQKANKKLWAAGSGKRRAPRSRNSGNSISFDCRLAVLDITGSIAHAEMLGQTGIIPKDDARKIVKGLEGLLEDAQAGKIEFRLEDEDIHMNIERLLHERIGAVAASCIPPARATTKVALDMHLYVRQSCEGLVALLDGLADVFNREGGRIYRRRHAGLYASPARAARAVRASLAGLCVDVQARYQAA